MSVCILTIPFDPAKEVFQDEVLTHFLLNKRVTAIQPQFFQLRDRAYWTVFVEYEPVLSDMADSAKGVDRLNDKEKLLFEKLREWRNQKAQKEEIPIFIIATNKQLVEIVKKAPKSLEALRQINGFGKKKIERHGKELIAILTHFFERKSSKKQQTQDPKPADAQADTQANTQEELPWETPEPEERK